MSPRVILTILGMGERPPRTLESIFPAISYPRVQGFKSLGPSPQSQTQGAELIS